MVTTQTASTLQNIADAWDRRPSGNSARPRAGAVQELFPSGDTGYATDTAALNAAANVAGQHVILAPGAWYVSDIGLTTSNVWLQGSGPGTVLNVLAGHSGIVVTGPGNLTVSDLAIHGGNYGIVVNGAYDSTFRDLIMTGQLLGGPKINGDAATEQHWTDVIMRGVGGIGFALDRTTTIYTGSIYLDRVRIVEPRAGATHGFRFNSTAPQPSLNIAFMTQCVADNYAGDACAVINCAQVFVAQCWFAINGNGPAGSAALRVSGGFQHSYTGCYTYSGLNDPSVRVEGAARGVDIGGGHVFDGTPTTVALGLAAVAVGGFTLGTYQSYCGGGLTDTPGALPVPPMASPGLTLVHGEEPLSRIMAQSTRQLTSGAMVATYFTAAKSELLSTIECQVNTAAAGATYAGMGLCTVAANGDLTLVAKGEALTLWTSAFQPVGGFNTKIGFAAPATYQKVAGQRYAVVALFVGTTAPALVAAVPSAGTPQSNAAVPGTTLGALSGTKTGMTTLGAIGTVYTAATISGWGWMAWFVLN
jgi:hypothetical protein